MAVVTQSNTSLGGMVISYLGKLTGADRVWLKSLPDDDPYEPQLLTAAWPCGATGVWKLIRYDLVYNIKGIAENLRDQHASQHGASPCVTKIREDDITRAPSRTESIP